MARTVYCQHLKKEGDGLDFQLYPGELGKRIYDNICKEAWSSWQKHQTMLINEHKLSTMDPEHRKFLEVMMVKYLFEGEDITVSGYTPEKK